MNKDWQMHDDHPGAEELAQRLEAYASARLSPNRKGSARIRTALIEEARMRVLATNLDRAPGGHRGGPRRGPALFLAAGLALATAAGVIAGSAPGGPLYEARLWLSTVTLPADSDARALERIRQIEERLVDAEQAAAAGDPHAVAAAIQAYEEAVGSALDEVGTDAARLDRLKAALGLHVTVLTTLADRTPDAAAGGINRAIEASQRAVDRINDTTPSSVPGPGATDPPATPTDKPGRTGKPGETEGSQD
jgi:hypothetical protein